MIKHTGIKNFEKSTTLHLQSLKEVHLSSMDIDHDENNYGKFNGFYLNVFEIVGFFILLIACINFMNLTVARASSRWKEVGLRKSLGARKAQLLGQFIFESVFLASIAVFLALAVDWAFLPVINQWTGKNLTWSPLLTHPLRFGWIFMISLLLGLLSGIYPSFYMSSFKLTSLIKGNFKTPVRSTVRNAMVILQFGLAIAMIECTLVVIKQISYMENSKMGFNKDNIVLLDMNSEVNKKYETLKTEWLRNNSILGVTASSQRLGNDINAWGFKIKTDSGIYNFSPSNLNVDYDYLKVYGISLNSGRDFSRNISSDKGMAFIINETMARDLGLKDPLGTPAGQAWYSDDSLGTIIGVVKDFNYNSFHFKINPIALVCHPEWGFQEISIRIRGKDIPGELASIKKVWDKNISTYPFTYTFLDDHFDRLYKSDQQMSLVITLAAILATIISSIGLFGLVTISVRRKIKEIGIRKVLGATSFQITTLLTANFTRIILVSFILVSPLAYYIMSGWLQNFAYRFGMGLSLFFLGGLIGLLIALITILYRILKSANENPVKSLRYE